MFPPGLWPGFLFLVVNITKKGRLSQPLVCKAFFLNAAVRPLLLRPHHSNLIFALDSAIVSVEHHYDLVEPAAELLDLVDACAKMTGSSPSLNKAMELMGKFCRENRKPAHSALSR